jgi:hypothetical protein
LEQIIVSTSDLNVIRFVESKYPNICIHVRDEY